MKTKTSLALFEYWNRRRAGRIAPLRGEIEPSDIRGILPNLFILEDIATGPPAFRLAGTGVCGLFGKELKGESLGALWLKESVTRVLRLAGGVFRDARPIVLDALGESRSGRPLELELILLPLSSGSGDTDRIVGSVTPLEQPFWLTLDPIVALIATSVRVVDADKDLFALQNRPGVPVDSGTAIFKSSGNGGAPYRIHHLTVLEGGRQD